MDRMLSLVVVAALAVTAFVAARGAFRRVVIREHQTGLLFRRGRLARTLGAGAYWIARPALRLVVVDTRPRIVSTAGQEVPVKDGPPIRATLAIRYPRGRSRGGAGRGRIVGRVALPGRASSPSVISRRRWTWTSWWSAAAGWAWT
jgi:hypothetical protein